MTTSNTFGTSVGSKHVLEQAASTGMPMTEAAWLDTHLEAYRPEYAAMLAWADLQPGWRVLDAGCGSGSFVPLIAARVGPTGSIAALDLAPDNVAALERRLVAAPLPCPVEGCVGSITALPYDDDQFDAVWVGNVLMYLDDDALAVALGECLRVLRPGGRLASKDPEPGLQRVYPADAMVLLRFLDTWRQQFGYERILFSSMFRTREMRRRMERAGFVDVRQRTFPIERWAPLTDVERQYFHDAIRYIATMAPELDLPEEDQAFWRIQLDHDSPNHLLNQPDFYSGASQVVAIGHVPSGEMGE